MDTYPRQDSIRHSEPPRGGGKLRYEVEHIPPAKNLVRICLSEQPHGQQGHWNGTTSRPHDLVDCEWCKKKMGWKWQGFFFAWNPALQVTSAVQFPQGVWGAMQEFLRNHGTMRGAKITLWRPKGFNTAPTAAHLMMPNAPGWTLPACPDMEDFLNRLFYGGWFGGGSAQGPTDPAGEQTQLFDNLPPGVLPVNRLVDQVLSNKKSNGAPHK